MQRLRPRKAYNKLVPGEEGHRNECCIIISIGQKILQVSGGEICNGPGPKFLTAATFDTKPIENSVRPKERIPPDKPQSHSNIDCKSRWKSDLCARIYTPCPSSDASECMNCNFDTQLRTTTTPSAIPINNNIEHYVTKMPEERVRNFHQQYLFQSTSSPPSVPPTHVVEYESISMIKLSAKFLNSSIADPFYIDRKSTRLNSSHT